LVPPADNKWALEQVELHIPQIRNFMQMIFPSVVLGQSFWRW
jgi:hypothetical protein